MDEAKMNNAAAPEAAASPEVEAEVLEAEVIDPETQVAEEADAAVEAAERLIAAEKEAADAKDQLLRLQAEWQNYRKRTESELADYKVRATERVMNDIMPVLDDFERAISYSTEHGTEGLLEGMIAISNKLNAALSKHGLKVIDPAGEPFDALAHQAVATVPDESVPDETVNQVFQKGYTLGSKVLRPAMVTISVGGPKRSTEE